MNECKIVEDLLPLYAEDLISAESADFIREHASRCPRCNKLLERTEQPLPETTDIPNYKKALKRERIQSILTGVLWCALLLVLAVLTIFLILRNNPMNYVGEPVVLDSPDGSYSFQAEYYTGLFGIQEGMEVTDTTETWRHQSFLLGWSEIVDARWSPDGTDLFLTMRKENGETGMLIWYHDYDGISGVTAPFPLEHYHWLTGTYQDLTEKFTSLLREKEDFPSGWTSITYEFVEWGDDGKSAHIRYETDQGHKGTVYFGFDFNYQDEKIWIIE